MKGSFVDIDAAGNARVEVAVDPKKPGTDVVILFTQRFQLDKKTWDHLKTVVDKMVEEELS